MKNHRMRYALGSSAKAYDLPGLYLDVLESSSFNRGGAARMVLDQA